LGRDDVRILRSLVRRKSQPLRSVPVQEKEGERRLKSSALRLAALALAATASLLAHDVITTKITWSREVSRVIYKRCIQCHTGDVSFATYEDARPWAKAIKEEVLARRMPPWGAVKGFGEFRNDNSLSQEEIDLIAQWVEGGAPEGDPNLLPERPSPATAKKQARPGMPVSSPLTLAHDITLEAIRPTQTVVSAKITAIEPDGTIEPLLWLYNYNSKWGQTFVYKMPLFLPKGTRIEMAPPVALELITATQKPAHQTKTYSPARASGTAPTPGSSPAVEKSR
jgi:mono/diheme cytochrome c family protein